MEPGFLEPDYLTILCLAAGVLIFGASLALSLGEAVRKDSPMGLSLLIISIGVLAFELGYVYSNLYWQASVDIAAGHPLLLIFSLYAIGFVFCIGPAFRLLAGHFLILDSKTWRSSLKHFVPALGWTFVVSMAVLFEKAEALAFNVLQVLALTPAVPAETPVFILFSSEAGRLILYCIILHPPLYSGYVVYSYLKKKQKWQLEFSIFLSVTLGIHYLVVFLVLFGFVFKQPALIAWGNIALGCLALYYIFKLISKPGFIDKVAGTVLASRYAVSNLGNVNRDALKAELVHLMDETKLYRMEDLSAAGLAGQLGVSYKQLSEFINSEFGQSFHQYINGYRIEEAKELLLARPDESVLKIAFDLGYNSKSTFNKQFKKQVGLNPTEYRTRKPG